MIPTGPQYQRDGTSGWWDALALVAIAMATKMLGWW